MRIFNDPGTLQLDLAHKQAFGALVLRLRTARGWSQRQLDQKSNVPWRTIFDIEHAAKAHLDFRTVLLLSDAFALTGQDRREFFLTAGLKPDTPAGGQDWLGVIRSFYREMQFPAFVLDHAFYVHSANRYMSAIMHVSFEQFAEKHRGYQGINVLHFLFDPDFGTRRLYGPNWESYVSVNVYLFRLATERHRHEERVQRTMRQLEAMESFSRVWTMSAQITAIPAPPYFITVDHPLYGTMQYWHAQPVMPDPFFEQHRALFYSPCDAASEAAFARLRDETPNEALLFPMDRPHDDVIPLI